MQNEGEQLSAAHDGEGNVQDLLRLLDAIDSDEDQRAEQAVYRLIGDTLRNPDSPVLSIDVTSAVMRSVAREPVPHIPANADVTPFALRNSRQRARSPSVWRALSGSAAAVAAVAFISALVWKFSAMNTDPVVAYVIFEQPRATQQVVQMDSMPPELVDYLLAHRQNSAAGSMNAGSALIRANLGDSPANPNERPAPKPAGTGGDMDWVRLWDARPVYVTPRAVER